MPSTLPSHMLFYGDGGGGKSFMAATADLPAITINFDGGRKLHPYLLTPHKFIHNTITVDTKIYGTYELTACFDPDDTKRERRQRLIYSFSDSNPSSPVAWNQFYNTVWPTIDHTMEQMQARTLVIDSASLMRDVHYNLSRKGGISDDVNLAREFAHDLRFLCSAINGKRYTTIFICHIQMATAVRGQLTGQLTGQEVIHDTTEWVAALPGQMSKHALVIHDNVFRVYADAEGKHYAQCLNNGKYIANNSVGAPMVCPNDLREVFKHDPLAADSPAADSPQEEN